MPRDTDQSDRTKQAHNTHATGDFLADAYVLQDAFERAKDKIEESCDSKNVQRLANLSQKYAELAERHQFTILMHVYTLLYRLYRAEIEKRLSSAQQTAYQHELVVFTRHIATVQRQALKRIARGDHEGDIKAEILRLDNANRFVGIFDTLADESNMFASHMRLDVFLQHFAQHEHETLDYFLPEAKTLLHNLNEALQNFDSNHLEQGINRFFRTLHTLKGSAYMVMLNPVGDISHLLEDVLSLSREGDASPESIRPTLQLGVQTLGDMVQYLEIIEGSASENLKALLAKLANMLQEKDSSQDILAKLYPLAEPSIEGEDIHAVMHQHVSPNQALPNAESLEADGWIGLVHDTQQTTAEVISQPVHAASKTNAAMPSTDITGKPETVALESATRQPRKLSKVRAHTLAKSDATSTEQNLQQNLSPHLQSILHDASDDTMPETPETLRVNTHDLDELMRLTGELILSRYQHKHHLIDMQHVEQRLLQAERYIKKLAQKLTNSAIQKELTNVYAHVRTTRQRSQFMHKTLQDDNRFLNDLGYEIRERLSHTRMVPLSQLFAQLHRLVEQLEKEQADHILEQRKNYRLEISGAHLEIDSALADALLSPLRHLVSNALIHGIESLPERAEKGKLPQGVIHLEATAHEKYIRIDVIDDGRGLSVDKVRTTALERGLKTVEEMAVMPEQDILAMILLPGFSTADGLTKHAGRGVGLDAVNTQVQKLKGRLSMHSKWGQGTRISLEIPRTLLSSQVLRFEVGAQHLSISAENVLGLRHIPTSLRSHNGAYEQITLDKRPIHLYDLGQLLACTNVNHNNSTQKSTGHPITAQNLERRPVIIVKSSKGPLLLEVTKLGKIEPAIGYPLPPALESMQHLVGVSLFENGRLAPLLHSDGIITLYETMRKDAISNQVKLPIEMRQHDNHKPIVNLTKGHTAQLSHTRGHILVAEDSTTVRELLAQWLRRVGFKVTAAPDGQKAFGALMKQQFDMLITDIEMPYMDGYELIEAARKHVKLDNASMPIIVISSRVRDEHRNLAMDLGANAYLTKPAKSHILMQEIQRLLPHTASN